MESEGAMDSAPVASSGVTISSRGGIIRWWEVRRLHYNLFVGLSGLISMVLVLVAGSAAVKPGVDFEEPLGMILFPIAFGIMANLCYTAGWITDIFLYRGAPRSRLFQTGLIFSIALAALPGLWAVIAWLITLYTGQKWD
jgi:hypothetical protein